MSDEIKKVDSDSAFADGVFHTSFERPRTDIGQATPKNRHPLIFLPLEGAFVRTASRQTSLGIVTERHELLELGRYIVRVLDPSPEDRILDALARIEAKMGQ